MVLVCVEKETPIPKSLLASPSGFNSSGHAAVHVFVRTFVRTPGFFLTFFFLYLYTFIKITH